MAQLFKFYFFVFIFWGGGVKRVTSHAPPRLDSNLGTVNRAYLWKSTKSRRKTIFFFFFFTIIDNIKSIGNSRIQL